MFRIYYTCCIYTVINHTQWKGVRRFAFQVPVPCCFANGSREFPRKRFWELPAAQRADVLRLALLDAWRTEISWTNPWEVLKRITNIYLYIYIYW